MKVDGCPCTLFPARLLLLLLPWLHVSVMTTDIYPWDGCLSSTSLDSEYCFSVSEPMYGDDAWKYCDSFHDRSTALIEALKETYGNRSLVVWSGYRESYSGSRTFITRSKSLLTIKQGGIIGPGSGMELCLSFDINNSDNKTQEWRPCRESKLPIICKQQKFRAMAYNASTSVACEREGAIALSFFPGCFVPTNCYNSTFTVRLNPVSKEHDVRYIDINMPIEVTIQGYRNWSRIYQRESATINDTREFCHIATNSLNNKVRLELRRNKTAGGIFLWVQNDRRTDWPPKCLGANVEVTEAHSRTLTVMKNPSNSTEATDSTNHLEQIWCFTKDVVTGQLVDSNRLKTYPSNDDCVTAESVEERNEGPPSGTVVDKRASCLRCLKIAFSRCGNETCSDSCTDVESCSLYGLHHDHVTYKDSVVWGSRCFVDDRCAANFAWNYTNTVGDCNGDGESDCDDRFSQLTSSCEREVDELFSSEREKYWNCRNGPYTDFVDLPEPNRNRTIRYYCLNEHPNKLWSSAYYMDGISSYVSTHERITEKPTSTPKLSVSLDAETERNFIHIVKNLQNIDEPLETFEAMEMVNNVSKVLSLRGNDLSKIQSGADILSLPDLVESVMSYIPNNFNMTTENVAVSRSSNKGILLTSELPTSESGTFGRNPSQFTVDTKEEILKREQEVEAAVLLSEPIPDDVELLIVTFADGADYVSSINRHEEEFYHNKTYNTSDSSVIPVSNVMSLDGKGHACVNSPVISASLLNSNKTKEKLPPNSTVHIFFRNKVPIRRGQEKYCVYLDEVNGIWKSDGCELVENTDDVRGVDICRCNHLTHFAQVVTDGELLSNSTHANLLHWLTVASCFVSLLGLMALLLTGLLLHRWRKEPENKVLMNLSAALSLFMALLLWQCLKPLPPLGKRCVQPEASVECRATGAILHFLVLASFCWMLAAAITHYLRLTTLSGPKGVSHFQLKMAVLGWCTPLLPVIVLLCVNSHAYSPRGRDFCYPHGTSFYTTVFTPVILVLLLNGIAFAFIMRQLFPKWFLCGNEKKDTGIRVSANERRIFVRKVLVSIVLTFLFGLTWMLGIVAYTPAMMYLLCVAAALQGPLLFIFFVWGAESVRSKIQSVKRSLRSPKDSHKPLFDSANRSGPSDTSSTACNQRWKDPAATSSF